MDVEHTIIVITGPESTGKSYLTQLLAEKFDLRKLEEYARAYINGLDRGYYEEDLEKIAAGQYAQLDNLDDSEPQYVLMDTDFLTIKIWGLEKYGRYPKNLESLSKKFPAFHYLLCRPDIAWEFDAQRENSQDRDRLFEVYESALVSSNFSYTIIEGNYKERTSLAINTVENLLKKGSYLKK